MIKKISIFALTSFLMLSFALFNTFATTQNDNKVTIDMNGGYVERDLFTKLEHELKPESITLIGDSTSNEVLEWFYVLADSWTITSHNISYRLWNNTNQSYDRPSYISVGSEGNGYIDFDGNDALTTPDKNSLDITSDFTYITKIQPDALTTFTQTLINKFAGAGNRGYNITINSSSAIYLWISDDGTNNKLMTSNDTLIGAGFDNVPLSPFWIKVEYDADNGSSQHVVKFYTSLNGTSWTQLGTDVVAAGTFNIHNTNSNFSFGWRDGSDYFRGKMFESYLYNENGEAVVDVNFGDFYNNNKTDFTGNTFTNIGDPEIGGSPNLTLYNESHAGAATAYFRDVTRIQKVYANNNSLLTLLNLSHNEGQVTNYTNYNNLIADLANINPNTNFILSTQNQQLAPNLYPEAHALRNVHIRNLANTRGYGLIDGFNAVSVENISVVDGTHPNPTGSQQWADEASNTFDNYTFKDTEYYIYVESGNTLTNYVEPIRNGYNYNGLYSNDIFTLQFNPNTDTISTTRTLYVQWTNELSTLLNLLPVLFLIIIISLVVLFIKFDTSSSNTQKTVTVLVMIVLGLVFLGIIQNLITNLLM